MKQLIIPLVVITLILTLYFGIDIKRYSASMQNTITKDESGNANYLSNIKSTKIEDESNVSLAAKVVNKGVEIEGKDLKAFLAAYEAFKEDKYIKDEKKKLENYNVKVFSDKENILVSFLVRKSIPLKNIPDEDSALGQDVTYILNKINFSVINRVIYK